MKRVILVAVVVLVLAGGAYVGMQLLTPEPSIEAGRTQVFEDVVVDGSGNEITVKTIIEPSPDLPQEPVAASGLFLREVDNSYFVGTGNISVEVQDINGEVSVAQSHSGPEIEVVITQDTLIYEDITDISWDLTESGERVYTQEIRQIDQPDEVGEGMSISVWGDRSGDRIRARFVVLSKVQ